MRFVTTPSRGHSLLEVAAATAMLATALVPALKLIRTSLANDYDLEIRNLMTTLCVSKLEEHLALGNAAWTDVDQSGSLSAEGASALRFRVVRSQSVVDGGISNQLMSVRVTVWEDRDSDTVMDSNEPRVVFRSKIAKLATYQTDVVGS
jgi:hypothetical protein